MVFLSYLWGFVTGNQHCYRSEKTPDTKVCLVVTLTAVLSWETFFVFINTGCTIQNYRFKWGTSSFTHLICLVLLCHLLLGQWCQFVIMGPIVYQKMTSVSVVRVLFNKKDELNAAHDVTRQHKFSLSLLKFTYSARWSLFFIYLSIFLICTLSVMVNTGLCLCG